MQNTLAHSDEPGQREDRPLTPEEAAEAFRGSNAIRTFDLHPIPDSLPAVVWKERPPKADGGPTYPHGSNGHNRETAAETVHTLQTWPEHVAFARRAAAEERPHKYQVPVLGPGEFRRDEHGNAFRSNTDLVRRTIVHVDWDKHVTEADWSRIVATLDHLGVACVVQRRDTPTEIRGRALIPLAGAPSDPEAIKRAIETFYACLESYGLPKPDGATTTASQPIFPYFRLPDRPSVTTEVLDGGALDLRDFAPPPRIQREVSPEFVRRHAQDAETLLGRGQNAGLALVSALGWEILGPGSDGFTHCVCPFEHEHGSPANAFVSPTGAVGCFSGKHRGPGVLIGIAHQSGTEDHRREIEKYRQATNPTRLRELAIVEARGTEDGRPTSEIQTELEARLHAPHVPGSPPRALAPAPGTGKSRIAARVCLERAARDHTTEVFAAPTHATIESLIEGLREDAARLGLGDVPILHLQGAGVACRSEKAKRSLALYNDGLPKTDQENDPKVLGLCRDCKRDDPEVWDACPAGGERERQKEIMRAGRCVALAAHALVPWVAGEFSTSPKISALRITLDENFSPTFRAELPLTHERELLETSREIAEYLSDDMTDRLSDDLAEILDAARAGRPLAQDRIPACPTWWQWRAAFLESGFQFEGAPEERGRPRRTFRTLRTVLDIARHQAALRPDGTALGKPLIVKYRHLVRDFLSATPSPIVLRALGVDPADVWQPRALDACKVERVHVATTASNAGTFDHDPERWISVFARAVAEIPAGARALVGVDGIRQEAAARKVLEAHGYRVQTETGTMWEPGTVGLVHQGRIEGVNTFDRASCLIYFGSGRANLAAFVEDAELFGMDPEEAREAADEHARGQITQFEGRGRLTSGFRPEGAPQKVTVAIAGGLIPSSWRGGDFVQVHEHGRPAATRPPEGLELLEAAIARAGGVRALARAPGVGVAPQTIVNWRAKGPTPEGVTLLRAYLEQAANENPFAGANRIRAT